MHWLYRVCIALIALIGVGIFVFLFWLYQLNQDVKARLEKGSFVPPTRYYSAPEVVEPGQKLTASQLGKKLAAYGYRSRNFNQRILDNDYSLLSSDQCRSSISDEFSEDLSHCVIYRNNTESLPALQLVTFGLEGTVLGTYAGTPLKQSRRALLPPQLFAQFLEGQPIFQRELELGEVPTACLNAVLAIEDDRFLDHAGISPTGILRAFIVNLKEGRAAQGGSTITQQLVKNLFLTHDKTLKRKVTEVGMSIVLEAQATKDQILQNYLNIIYLGQAGPYQVRGYKAASKHYFDKEISELDLGECALLASIINNPGRYNPFRNPEPAKTRRTLVLSRMEELNLIGSTERIEAEADKLPENQPQYTAIGTAAYYVDAVGKELKAAGVDVLPGLSIYTALDTTAQTAAEEAMGYLEKLDERIQKRKPKDKPKPLQGALIGVDPANGKIKALAGGRNFRSSPYNRAVDSERQVGSVMKPFVYLAALESYDENGEFYDPLTPIKDEAFTHRYEGQKWTPVNYGRTYFGEVPMFFALKNSLNAATAKLGLDLGLDPVIDVARRLGVTSPLDSLPSLTLGAFELNPIEVAKAYTAIARLGSRIELSTLYRVEDEEGEVIFEPKQEISAAVDPNVAALLIGMMKQTLISGTAASAKAWGFDHPAAGKTGTTSDNRDAWFAGFTPHNVAISWVGYDDNASHGLTGASGALPLWAQYMREISRPLPKKDFAWPEDVEARLVERSDVEIENPKLDEKPEEFPVEMIFRR